MSKKVYAIALVLAGMICGMLLVSLISSPAAAKLSTEERIIVEPGLGKAPTKALPPVVAFPNIQVYPVGTGGKDDDNSYAYIVKEGKLWYCENTLAREVKFR